MTVHRSRVDWWLAVIIVAVPIVALVAAIALQLGGDAGEAIVGWAALVGIGVLYAVVVWPVEYRLEADALVIRFGMVRSRVTYRSIRSVSPTRSWLAAPALSMERLGIDTGVPLPTLISPRDRIAFLDDLAGRAPHLVRDGDALVPRRT